MTTMMAPICVACKHFQGWAQGSFGGYCAAYPDGGGIPRAILLSEADHRQPYAGDHGITFTPRHKSDAGYPALIFDGASGATSGAPAPAPKSNTTE